MDNLERFESEARVRMIYEKIYKTKNVRSVPLWVCGVCGHRWVRQISKRYEKPKRCSNQKCTSYYWEK